MPEQQVRLNLHGRKKRTEQLPVLKGAVFLLAQQQGRTIEASGCSVIEIALDTLLVWVTPWIGVTWVDVWDQTLGGSKVLNMWLHTDGGIEVLNFRRGDWENVLIDAAKKHMH
jgi:hypothetical protein